jgi:excinuclease ABC subunit C
MRMAAPRHASVSALSAEPGVYRFRDAQGRVLYIGRAINLRRRVGSYWGGLRGRRHLLRMVAQIDRVEAVTCDSEHEAAWLERNLLERSKPRWNRTAGGQETPVYIRLERSAGLKLVYDHSGTSDSTPTFGPYLGSCESGRPSPACIGSCRWTTPARG